MGTALLSLAGCATSPTGRKQVMLAPDAQMNSMGAQAFDQMKQETPIDSSPASNAYVRCITDPITAAARGQTDVKEWEVVVFKDESANAFALPGGKIGVHTGIMKVAKSDAQLAAVLGHEVGHVIARHGNERVSQGLLAQGVMLGAGAMAADSPYRGMILGALGLGAQFGVLLPYGRTQENEADVIGQKLMAQAGFDPRQSVELWKNMAAASGGKSPPEFMSTHPAEKNRISSLEKNMPEAMRLYEQARAAGKRPSCKLQ
jgi:predicted Zn-dependent protease